jgi:hypothetical protein
MEKQVIFRLQRLGYLPPAEIVTPDVLSLGVKDFQLVNDIEVSGELDAPTQLRLDSPRCGVSDREFGLENFERSEGVDLGGGRAGLRRVTVSLMSSQGLLPCPWPDAKRPVLLNYSFFPGTSQDLMDAVKAAMNRWEKVADEKGNKIVQFVSVAGMSVNFTVGWILPGNAAFNFDVDDIAHACLPCKCDTPKIMKFRSGGIVWTTNGIAPGMLSVEAVATHELGHILGLVHPKKFTGTTMDPNFSDKRGPQDIHPDDAQSLRYLYPA